MRGFIFFLILVIIACLSIYFNWYKKSAKYDVSTASDIPPLNERKKILIGKWDYRSELIIPRDGRDLTKGTLEFNSDSSYTLRFTKEYYDWNSFGQRFDKDASELIGGTVKGIWNIDSNIIELDAQYCNITQGHGFKRIDSSNCYQFQRVLFGNWNNDHNEMKTLQFSENKLRFFQQILSNKGERKIAFERKK